MRCRPHASPVVARQGDRRARALCRHRTFWLLVGTLAGLLSLPALAEVAHLREVWSEVIADSPFDEPVHVTSQMSQHIVKGRVTARLPYPFHLLAAELPSAVAWCEMIFVHINVKACVHDESNAMAVPAIRLYVGRKRYQHPEIADVLELHLHVASQSEDALAVELNGDRGPYGTRDYRMHIQVIPYNEEESLIRMDYSLRFGVLARVAMRVYFAMGGRERVGFSIEEVGQDGEPVYVDGLRGMIERNVMRFYLALQAHLETRTVAEEERLQARLQHWFALTGRYPRQLYELDEATYLRQKQREFANQEALQRDPRSVVPADPWSSVSVSPVPVSGWARLSGFFDGAIPRLVPCGW